MERHDLRSATLCNRGLSVSRAKFVAMTTRKWAQ